MSDRHFSRLTSAPLLAVALVLAAGAAARAADYTRTLTNTYVAQSTAFYCGPASALMVLNSSTINLNPAQGTLYTSIQTYQNGLPMAQQTSYVTSPLGMQNVLQTNDGAHTYVAYNIPGMTAGVSGYDQAVRILAYDVDNYRVPAAALINRGAHWVDVYGVNTNVTPTSNGNFTVNGFNVRDPWTGFAGAGTGLGKDVYIANTANGWQRSFTVQGYGNWNFGAYTGNYAFVADPDPDADAIDIAEPSFPAPPVASPATSSDAAGDAAFDLGNNSDLIANFHDGAFDASAVDDHLITLDNGGHDWLVPYDVGGNITGALLIDEATGVLDEAYFGDAGATGSLDDLYAEAAYDAGSTSLPDIINDNQVPEPASLSLLALGVSGLLLRRKRNSSPS